MKDIAEAIKERRAAILRLQGDLEVLERARALLNGGSDVPSALAIAIGNTVAARDRVRRRVMAVHPMKGKINPKSSIGHTVVVLREAGVPVHINDVLSRIKKHGGEAKKTSLVSSIMKMCKHGHVFYKTEQPSTFGLLEWEKAKITARS